MSFERVNPPTLAAPAGFSHAVKVTGGTTVHLAGQTALDAHGATMNVLTARYLNRLSDLLFILGRVANGERGDVLWVPGGQRN